MEITSRVQLVELMKQLKLPLVAVEVGTAEGIFSQELLHLGIEKLYLVDIWEQLLYIPGCASFEQWWHRKNYKEVQEKFKSNSNVILLKGLSTQMAARIPDNSLGLVYLDADHSYEGVTADLNAFYPKLVNGGIMAGHDFRNQGYGVEKAVYDFAKDIQVHELVENGDINNFGFWFIKK